MTLGLTGALTAVSGTLIASQIGAGTGTTATGMELDVIAAVIIGGTMLKGGFGRIGGTVIGALILTAIGNILNLTDIISNYLNGAVQGVIIVAAVYLQRGSFRAGRKAKPSE